VYLNPLIGGSRYADADRLLAALDQRPSLQWLHVIKRRIQRAFFAPVVQDLTPESDFQQTIFGFASPTPIFAGRTVIFLTEKAGSELDIRPERTLRFFGRTRAQLLERMGTVASLPPDVRTGHRAPLDCPEIVEGLIDQALARAIAREGPLLTSPVYGSAHGGGPSA
jgi:hypothetical protein